MITENCVSKNLEIRMMTVGWCRQGDKQAPPNRKEESIVVMATEINVAAERTTDGNRLEECLGWKIS